MPHMTLSEAAKWAGKGRPAILKAIQRGTISAEKTENNEWRIDPSELARVYEPADKGNGHDVSESVDRSTLDIGKEIAWKDRELALMREMLDASRREAVDIRQERDSWKEEAGRWQAHAEAQTRLLAHHRATEAAEPSRPVRRGFLARLWGSS